MVGTLSRRLFLSLLAALIWIGFAAPVTARCCPFCGMQGQTLTGDVNQASMVLFGTLANAKIGGAGDFSQGTTDLQIEAVIKKHDILGDKKVITLPRYVPDKTTDKFLVFCDVFKGKIDPYRGIPVKGGNDIVKYLKGAMDVKDKDVGTRLKFFFDYLDNPELEINTDAYKEFANADYKDYKDMAKSLPAEKIAKWLQNPDTPQFRYGLYASMLGHCGTEKDAELLHHMLADSKKRLVTGVDGVLAGYVMLKPKDGWKEVRGILGDPSKDFMLRYAALRTVRFFWDYRPDLVDKKDLVEAAGLLLDQSDIADMAIEDLRKWNRWEKVDEVLDLNNKQSHDIPIVRRAILRYALSCPKPKAADFIQKMRKKDPELVKDAEELLKLETVPPAKPVTQGKPVVTK